MTNLQSFLTFDGVDDLISLPAMNVDYSQGFSAEAWVNYKSFKHWSRIIDFGNGANSDNIVFANYGSTNTLALSSRQGTRETQLLKPEALTTNQWIHVVTTIDSAGNGKLYKNGEEIATGAALLPNSINRATNYIAKSNWGNDGYFHGSFAEIRIWKKVRTQAEIKADMNRRLTGKEEGLVAYYPLNGDVLDHSSNNHNGTINGNPSWESEDLDFLKPADTKDVKISNIFYKGDNKILQANEYVEITNNDTNPANLSGWKIVSAIGREKEFTFPENTILAAGKSFRVYTNEIHPETGGFSFGSTDRPVWKDKGDEAQLFDKEGNLISKLAY